jgi:hypothetical protein
LRLNFTGDWKTSSMEVIEPSAARPLLIVVGAGGAYETKEICRPA